MGSSPPATKKISHLLPNPHKHNLVSHFILGEIIDHISLIHDDFPEVDVPLLQEHLWAIRNKSVKPEGHLRGFLNVLKGTKVFKDAFNELDDGMKVQLNTFMAGGGEEVIWAAGGKGDAFHIPPSPAVKHHFREVAKVVEEKVEKLFHHERHANSANGTNDIAMRQVKKAQEQVEKVQEQFEKAQEQVEKVQEQAEKVQEMVHQRVDELFHREHYDHAVNGSASKEDVVDEYAVKPPVTNGHHVEIVKDGLEKLFHHENRSSGTNGHANNGYTVDEFAVKPPAIIGHIENPISSTAGFPRIFEDQAQTKTMEVYGNQEFQNWGQTVHNTPLWTFIPKTILGLQNLVKWAKLHDLRVRCGGYRHSWSSTFSQNKHILVSLLNLEEVTKLPDAMSIEAEYIDPENKLKTITLGGPPGVVPQSGKALVRVGVSVTNEQFRRWAVANDQWTLPVDVILVE
jgi:hypothetical protein